MPCRVSFSGRVTLGRDDGRQALLLEPAEQAPDLGAQDARVRQFSEEGLDGVQHDALRPDLLHGIGDANEEAVEVVLPGFRNLDSRDEHVVEEQLLLGHQRRQVEPERCGVDGQVGNRFLERHEHAGFAVLRGASNQKLEAEHRLAGTGAAADQSRAPLRQPSSGDFVQTLNAGERLPQRLRRRSPCSFPGCHLFHARAGVLFVIRALSARKARRCPARASECSRHEHLQLRSRQHATLDLQDQPPDLGAIVHAVKLAVAMQPRCSEVHTRVPSAAEILAVVRLCTCGRCGEA